MHFSINLKSEIFFKLIASAIYVKTTHIIFSALIKIVLKSIDGRNFFYSATVTLYA